jgi:hypothetical protein
VITGSFAGADDDKQDELALTKQNPPAARDRPAGDEVAPGTNATFQRADYD